VVRRTVVRDTVVRDTVVRHPARLALAAALLAGLALPAALPAAALAATAAAGTAAARKVTGSPVSVAITSVNPAYAKPGQKVTVRGVITNSSSKAVGGLSVQLRSSSRALADRDQLQQYAAGTLLGVDVAVPGAVTRIGLLRPGAKLAWKVVLPVNKVHMTSFGVYPLAAQAVAAGNALGASWTFLPYWPTAKNAVRPRRDDIAWIWPLIDTPAQGPCGGLLNNNLAASLSSGGRLAGLLSAGSSAAGKKAQLTWALDPALVSSAYTMAGAGKKLPYEVGAGRYCGSGTSHPASPVAGAWLSRLRSALSGQPAFVTPYADVDIAALVRANLGDDLHKAYAEGRYEAGQILHRNFAPTAAGAGSAKANALISEAAWPAGGLANYTMLENLAGVDGIRTMVLSSAAMPPAQPSSFTPSAVTRTPNGEQGDMRILLADSTLTQILGLADAKSDPPGASFAVRQRFLAETAMIAAEQPGLSRAIVVAPPRHWDPEAGLASALLGETDSAPWLAPVSAGSLAADKKAPGQVARKGLPLDGGSSDELSRSLLRAVKATDPGVRLVESLQVHPNQQLYWAVAGIESSAWRGGRGAERPARALLRQVTTYVASQKNGVYVTGAGRDTLGGQNGSVPVYIDNRLSYPVQVMVRWQVDQPPGGGFSVLTKSLGVVDVGANTVVTEHLRVRAAAVGSTTIELRLVTRNGQVLGSSSTTTIQATHFGTFALIILAAALGVFMITSAARAARRGRTPAGPGRDDPARDDEPSRSGAGGHEQPEETDNVGHDRAVSDAAGTDNVATEDADDYARVPGWADRR
jgi:hypothetical protein